MTERTVTIRGREEDVATILRLLRHMEYLGNVGASRNLLVRVDGDGWGPDPCNRRRRKEAR